MATGFPTASVTVVDPGLPDAIVGVPYSYFLDAVDGVPPFTWALIGGALPTGLSLTAGTGEVSGTPTAVGTFSPEFEASDSGIRTGSRITPLRVVPNLGSVRRYQQESAVFDGTSIVPIEGSTMAEMRRKLARLLVRTDTTQITQPYLLDARDLQVESFDAVPFQSVDDALRLLLAAIAAFGTGLEDSVGGMTTINGNGKFDIRGVAPITVTVVGNEVRIGSTVASLSSPFDMLPAPSGDASGVTDTAALVAFFAGSTQDWVFSPQDEADDPYYINADINSTAGTQLYRISGKNRRSFRVVGVGAVRQINQIVLAEHMTGTNIRCYPNTTIDLVQYEDCRLILGVAEALVAAQTNAKLRDSIVELNVAGATLSDDHRHLEMDSCYILPDVGAGAHTSVTPDPANASQSFTRISDCHFWVGTSQVSIDCAAMDDNLKLVLLGTNTFHGLGTPILRPTVGTVPNYAEAIQLVDVTGAIAVPSF